MAQDPPIGDPDRELETLLADAVAAEAGRERTAERMLRAAAEESATFVGTLVDLAERAEPLTVRTTGGRVHRGLITAVGRNFVVVRGDRQPPAFLALGAIASVRASRTLRGDVAGDRPPPYDASLAAVVAGLASERPRVQLGVQGESGLLLGVLRSAGLDVVTLRLEGSAASTLLVPLHAVQELVLLDLLD